MTDFVKIREMFGSLHGDIENSFVKEDFRLSNGNRVLLLTCAL